MLRRTFLTSLTAATALTTLPRPAAAAPGQTLAYTPGLIDTALSRGQTLFVDYAADWCSTCARQERIIHSLRAAEPAYDKHIVFIRVDWDSYGRDPVATARRIPRRSTLIVLKGDKELGRIVAGTAESKIKALMDTALAAATST